MRRIGRHISRNAVAYLALFFALSGTAIAGKGLLITGEQIQDESLTGADVLNGSVTAADIDRVGLDADLLDGLDAQALQRRGTTTACSGTDKVTGIGTSGDVSCAEDEAGEPTTLYTAPASWQGNPEPSEMRVIAALHLPPGSYQVTAAGRAVVDPGADPYGENTFLCGIHQEGADGDLVPNSSIGMVGNRPSPDVLDNDAFGTMATVAAYTSDASSTLQLLCGVSSNVEHINFIGVMQALRVSSIVSQP